MLNKLIPTKSEMNMYTNFNSTDKNFEIVSSNVLIGVRMTSLNSSTCECGFSM